jgi:hypothetical protein
MNEMRKGRYASSHASRDSLIYRVVLSNSGTGESAFIHHPIAEGVRRNIQYNNNNKKSNKSLHKGGLL